MNKGLGNLYIQDLALHPENQEMIFAATKEGLYRSVNGGEQWFSAMEGITSQDITSIAMSTDGTVIFVGTWGDGLFVSTNEGEIWIPLNQNLGDPRVSQIAIAPSDQNVIYLGTSSGVSFSLDGGANWQKHAGILYHLVKSVVVYPDQPGVVYAGTRGYGIFLSRDTTRTWLKWSAGLHYDPSANWSAPILDLEIKKDDPDFITAASGAGFYKSTNGGENWYRHTEGLKSSGVNHICFSPANDGKIYVSSPSGFYVSEDDGESWQQLLDSNNVPFEIRTFEFSDESTVYLGTWGGGIYKFRIK